MAESQKVVRMPAARKAKKTVPAKQAAIDSLPYRSGDWVVQGVPGLVVRCGARTKVFRVVRRIGGRQVKRVLGELSLAEARRAAMQVWRDLKPKPAGAAPIPTLREALESYLREKELAPRTAEDYRYTLEKYMPDLLDRRLDVLALDRAWMRARIAALAKQHGAATAALTLRVYRAVHNWARKIHPDLAESPTTACVTPRVRPRDWALADADLRRMGEAMQCLSPVKRAWWMVTLLTGARASSVTSLKWEDIDLEKKMVRFRVVKGNRPYAVPLADRLAEYLREYREVDWLPNRAGWLFPSPANPEQPLWAQVRNVGMPPAHALRHTMRTRLAEAGATPDLARIVLGHSLSQDVSQRYITASLLVEAVRPLVNAVAERYAEVLGWQ
jgi:integrase